VQENVNIGLTFTIILAPVMGMVQGRRDIRQRQRSMLAVFQKRTGLASVFNSEES
jgi:hypothetical protein